MSVSILTNWDLSDNQLLNTRIQQLASDPTGLESKFYYNTTAKEIRFHNGTSWVALGPAGAGGPPTGAATGDLTGSYPAPQIAAGVIVDADINASAGIQQSKITTLVSDLAAKLSTATAATTYLALSGGTVTGPIILAADPAAALGAATKQYVDNMSAGLSWKDAVRAATTTNGAIATAFANGQVIDGVTLATGNRILLKNQTTTSENGIYTVNSSGAPTRATDADLGTEVENMCVFVEEGTTNADTSWVCTTNAPITVGTTGLTIVQFGGGAAYVGGAGITQNGNTFDIVSTSADLTVGADNITVVSAPKWTTARTISLTGDVTGSVSVDGSANASIATTNANMPKFFAGDVGSGTAPVITHNLNTKDVTVEVYLNSTPWNTVFCDVERTTVNTVTLRFSTSVTASAYRCVVTGR